MEKRFQVFVSSTYTDLLEERAEVMQALLELDCIPSGMELFPAASDEQWNWIKRVIDESDYYLVIIGGRYGTVSEKTGLSFTEMEYRYAIEIDKPVIAFLHENPGSITSDKTENSEENKKKLKEFKKFVEKRLCKYWNNPSDLGAKASRSITQLIKHKPAIGWVRADLVSEANNSEILALKRKIEDLEGKLAKASTEEPSDTAGLAKGKDTFYIGFKIGAKEQRISKNDNKYWAEGKGVEAEIETSWESLFKYLAPSLINGCHENYVVERINSYSKSKSIDLLEEKHPDKKFSALRIYADYFNLIKIQLRALKLIHIDEEDVWYLTPYGDNYMTKLIAIHKS